MRPRIVAPSWVSSFNPMSWASAITSIISSEVEREVGSGSMLAQEFHQAPVQGDFPQGAEQAGHGQAFSGHGLEQGPGFAETVGNQLHRLFLVGPQQVLEDLELLFLENIVEAVVGLPQTPHHKGNQIFRGRLQDPEELLPQGEKLLGRRLELHLGAVEVTSQKGGEECQGVALPGDAGSQAAGARRRIRASPGSSPPGPMASAR